MSDESGGKHQDSAESDRSHVLIPISAVASQLSTRLSGGGRRAHPAGCRRPGEGSTVLVIMLVMVHAQMPTDAIAPLLCTRRSKRRRKIKITRCSLQGV
ncbi:hypothetical protein BJV78DRAFT_1239525, partial [Lactifluus subvellereus]